MRKTRSVSTDIWARIFSLDAAVGAGVARAHSDCCALGVSGADVAYVIRLFFKLAASLPSGFHERGRKKDRQAEHYYQHD